MNSPAESLCYQHTDLPHPSTHVRLLQICSIDETRDVPIHCELTICALDTDPEYTAISYTWGEPNLLELILVDGKRMEVRQNCSYVLRQVWGLKRSGHIWIDAICINQTDNREKGPQVAMMGSIYHKATQTFACVGRHKDDSEFLYETLQTKSHFWNRSGRRGRVLDRFQRRFTKERLLRSLNSFFRRPYFRRVWIYQELFFGRAIQVCCGNESAQISMLLDLHKTMFSRGEVSYLSDMAASIDTKLPDLLIHSDRFALLLRAGHLKASQELGSLATKMRAVNSMQCDDPRDRVYGTLATVNWEGVRPIEPDYSKDRLDLALEVLRSLFRPPFLLSRIMDVNLVAANLLLTEEPSNKLNDAVQERLLLRPSHVITTNERKPDKGNTQDLMRFWGAALHQGSETWNMELDLTSQMTAAIWSGQKPRDPVELEVLRRWTFPSVRKWSNGPPPYFASTHILLPQDAQPRDWILVPSLDSSLPEDGTFTINSSIPAFLARHWGDFQLHIVGKALIYPWSYWHRVAGWERFWGIELDSPKFGVHVCPEDMVLLSHSCSWEDDWSRAKSESHRRQFAEHYFETRLSSAASRSYVIRMDC